MRIVFTQAIRGGWIYFSDREYKPMFPVKNPNIYVGGDARWLHIVFAADRLALVFEAVFKVSMGARSSVMQS